MAASLPLIFATRTPSFDGCVLALVSFLRSKKLSTDGLEESKYIKFQSDMSPHLHSALNSILNKEVEASASKTGAYLSYQRHRIVDRFYHGDTGNIRVTTDEATGKILCSVIKERIADMHVHFPNSPFDIRISVSVEKPALLSEKEVTKRSPKYERIKNRVSYSLHQQAIPHPTAFLICDLTQVTSNTSEPMTHEFEVELCDPKNLTHENGAFESIVCAYWTSIRQLAFSLAGPVKF
ncbi:hypothetical protein DI09_24p180 [Mitosporidium daphniae]|uniref:mRNA-capping enzyme subunit beta n=1 Tax=Mitosporidium daphniae TaxID=1485682 RepID=A0A098VSF2_9MICR|nr:uncharacterized protein DI09_24p180 [Mitosporidium daphniae]KGG51897.1 hypothetical protein DI09_24p180 [Mitosporidium daphniae]|eukprot:XP_013238324.1 uncharacterized protein DI09_24p180 [Mitosporidium daphniae]